MEKNSRLHLRDVVAGKALAGLSHRPGPQVQSLQMCGGLARDLSLRVCMLVYDVWDQHRVMAIPERVMKQIRDGHYTLRVTSAVLHKLQVLDDVLLERQASDPISRLLYHVQVPYPAKYSSKEQTAWTCVLFSRKCKMPSLKVGPHLFGAAWDGAPGE